MFNIILFNCSRTLKFVPIVPMSYIAHNIIVTILLLSLFLLPQAFVRDVSAHNANAARYRIVAPRRALYYNVLSVRRSIWARSKRITKIALLHHAYMMILTRLAVRRVFPVRRSSAPRHRAVRFTM